MEIELKYLFDTDARDGEDAGTKQASVEKMKNEIFADEEIQRFMDAGSEEVIPMDAIYLDTADGALRKKGIAFRVRQEGSQPVATLKWGGKQEAGLHVRGELNVSVGEDFVKAPSLAIFQGSEIYEELAGIVGSATAPERAEATGEPALEAVAGLTEASKAGSQGQAADSGAAAGEPAHKCEASQAEGGTASQLAAHLIPVMEMKFTRRQVRLDTGLSISEMSLDEGEIITINGNEPILELEIELYAGDQEDMIALGGRLEEKYHLKKGLTSKFQRGLALLGEK